MGDYRDFYEIMDRIEKGDVDSTYKAKMKDSDKIRTIKIFNKKFYCDYVDFSKIIKIMKIVQGENQENLNTIKFFESFETEDEFVLVEEFYDEELEKLRKEKKTFSVETIKEILTQLNNTFKIMDKNKIVHRDIKPENIFITYKNKEKSEYTIKLGRYEVSDFILNEYLDLIVGTHNYMAPEILAEEKYNEKCDLWSLGVVIYLLCFNEFPYHGTSKDLLRQYKSSERKTFKKSGNDALDDLIRKLLVPDPKERIGWKDYFGHQFFIGK